MAFIKIYDESSELEITVFPTLFETVNSITNKNNINLNIDAKITIIYWTWPFSCHGSSSRVQRRT